MKSLRVSWADDVVEVSIKLSSNEWRNVENGMKFGKKGRGYWYEGEFFPDYWEFNGGGPGSLIVWYGDDGAQGFVGKIDDAITEPEKPQ
jgi:hypothetical protein